MRATLLSSATDPVPPELQQLRDLSAELNSWCTDGLAYIGGLAITAHAWARPDTRVPIEVTHDGDCMMSLRDFADLRDIEEITPNRRLNKHQLLKGGYEFDLYIEHQHGLCIPWADVAAHRETRAELPVAALEHLLILKAEAAVARAGTAKGQKDRRDLARALILLGPEARPEMTAPWWRAETAALVASIGHAEALELAGGNAHAAHALAAHIQRSQQCLLPSRRTSGPSPLPAPRRSPQKA